MKHKNLLFFLCVFVFLISGCFTTYRFYNFSNSFYAQENENEFVDIPILMYH